MRSRMGLVQIQDRLSNKDSLGATIDATNACNILSNWDRRNNLDSKGAHVFRELWRNVDFNETTDTIFSVKFDVKDPVNTPRGLITNDDTRTALGDSIKFFRDKNIALGASLSDLQYIVDTGKNDERIAMHGGFGREGVFNVAETRGTRANDGANYVINFGPTYMQTITFDSSGPVAEAFLGYSQASDTTRPFHRDQSRRYSDKKWIRLPLSASDVSDQAIGDKMQLKE